MSEEILRFRGRVVSRSDIAFIRQLIELHPQTSRRRLSVLLCQAWKWTQPNGQFKDMVCRSLMLLLHRQGHITLPAKVKSPRNNVAARGSRQTQMTLSLEPSPLAMSLKELGSLELAQVRRTSREGLFEQLIHAHHYLGYTQPIGEHLKYLVYAQGQPVAAMAWASSTPNVAHRDRFVGWTREQCARGLASHLLGQMARRISRDWQQLYGHPVHLLETFVDPERFGGTSYLAANWIDLGLTTGRGKNDRTQKINRSRKRHLVYPLRKDWRQKLVGGA
jgi:hypothetical protein